MARSTRHPAGTPDQACDPTPFERFVGDIIEVLGRPRVQQDGMAVDLAKYLASEEHKGDEQALVDPLVRDILRALGWRDEHIVYNRGEGHVGRPDFQVFTSSGEEPDPHVAPVLIVESKATSVRSFSRTQPGREESPMEQLRRYVCSLGVHSRMGLLCNGHVLEAWTFQESPAPVLRLDLAALGRQAAVVAQGAPLDPKALGALGVLWHRCGLRSFTDSEADMRRIAESVALSAEEQAGILAEAARGTDPRFLEAALVHGWEGAWKKRANNVCVLKHRDALVQTLGRLIEAMSADVRHQLDDLLARVEGHDQALRQEDERADLETLLRDIRLMRRFFDLDEMGYDERCIRPLLVWRERPRKGRTAEQVESIWDALKARLRGDDSTTGEQLRIAGIAPQEVRRRKKESRQNMIEQFQERLRSFCNAAVDLALERERIVREHASAMRAYQAWNLWVQRMSSTVLVGADEEKLHQEFTRQTAYIYIVRLLLVRICEDKGLFRRKFSDGGLVAWQDRAAQYLDYAAGRSYEYLTRMAYECAQNVYVHFYGASEVFDWYQMDEKRLVRVLAALNEYDLAEIDADIIGAVYGTYLREGKHETGRYYTARSVVRRMLDHAGWTTERLMGSVVTTEGILHHPRLLDPACGSGSFLVEATRRLLDACRAADGSIPTEAIPEVLERVRSSIHGFDINPFACYLAEINLLIQVLDLVRQARAADRILSVDRFRVFCDDAIVVDETLVRIEAGFLPVEGRLTDAIKARSGPWAGGFDVIVANPPYVRADEGDQAAAYRARIARQDWFTTAHKKWDLYVPFVERATQLLSDSPQALACFITINSICNAPYAGPLRHLLASNVTLQRLVFAEKVKLFPDAPWQSNLIFCFSRGRPPAGWTVPRFFLRVDERGEVSEEEERPMPLTDVDRLFNSRPGVELDERGTVALGRICYVTVGMVLNSNEKCTEGEEIEVPIEHDPALFGEEEVRRTSHQRTVRHKPFTRDQLVAPERSAIHARPYLDGEDVLRGGIGQHRWLEYGPHTRCPAQVRRPTFPELYDRPKIMFGTFSGAAVDQGSPPGFLCHSDSIRLGIRWCDLAGVDNRSLAKARREVRPDPTLSETFSLWYLLALFLSAPIQDWLRANKRSMKDHVYPDDVKILPVKVLSPERQAPFVALARERYGLWAELGQMRAAGAITGSHGAEQVVPRARGALAELLPLLSRALPLYQLDRTDLVVWDQGAEASDLGRVEAKGLEISAGRVRIGAVPPSAPGAEGIAGALARLLREGGGTLADRAQDLVPGDAEGWLMLAEALDEPVVRLAALQARRAAVDRELDIMAWDLYRPAPAQPR